MKLRTLSERITLIAILTGALGIATLILWNTLSFQQIERDTENQIRIALSQASITLDNFFENTEAILKTYQILEEGQTLESLQLEVEQGIIVDPLVKFIWIYDLDYRAFAHSAFAQPELFENFGSSLENNAPLISKPYEWDEIWYADIVAPMSTSDGEHAGYIRIVFNTQPFLTWWESLQLPAGSATALLTDDGILWLRLPFQPELTGRDVSSGPLVNAIRTANTPEGISRFIPVNTDNVERFVGWQTLDSYGFLIATGLSTEHVTTVWRERYLPSLMLNASLLILVEAIILLIGWSTLRTEKIQQQYIRRLNALHQIDQAALSGKTAEQIGEVALKELNQLVPHQISVLFLKQPSTQKSVMLAQYTRIEFELFPAQYTLTPPDEIQEKLNQGLIYVLQKSEQQEFSNNIEDYYFSQGISAVAFIPLTIHKTSIGTVIIATRSIRNLSKANLNISRETTDHIAIVLKERQLRWQIEQYNQQLEQRVVERTAELEQANLQLQELDKMKSQFVADVSHELRTPLAGINTRLHLLERDKQERSAEHINLLRQRIKQLNTLVLQTLDLSRLDLTHEQIAFTEVDLNEVTQMMVEAHRLLAKDADLEFEWIPYEKTLIIWGEENQLSQVISNLIVNAIHYTEEGKISISTSLDQKHNRAICKVEDTGIGISEDAIPRLFERFYRADSVRQSNIPGTGLGLAIVKQIVDLHKGEIIIQSEINQGTQVTVFLPLAQPKD